MDEAHRAGTFTRTYQVIFQLLIVFPLIVTAILNSLGVTLVNCTINSFLLCLKTYPTDPRLLLLYFCIKEIVFDQHLTLESEALVRFES